MSDEQERSPRPRMRVLIVKGPTIGRGSDHGSSPRDFYEAAASDHLRAHGVEADFVSFRLVGLVDRLLAWRTPLAFLIASEVVELGLFVKALVRMHRYDVVLGWYRAGFYLAMVRAVLRLRRPYVALVIYRAFNPYRSDLIARMKRRLCRWGFRHVERVFCVASPQAEVFATQLGVPLPRVRAITMGIDASFFKPNGARPSRSDRPVVLIPGDADRDERAVVEDPRLPGLHVVRVCRATWNTQPAPAVHGKHWLEYLQNVAFSKLAELYGRADVVILPVANQTHPAGLTSLLECMAAGRPVLISRGLTTADYVLNGETALVYEPTVVGDLDDKLRLLLSSESLRSRLGEAARRRVEERFAFRPCSALLARELLSIVQDPAAVGRGRPSE